MMSVANKGLLAVISGPSGVGKSTVIKQLLARPEFALSVSATTRAARPGESEAEDYYFLDRKTFEARIAADEFLEWAEVHGKNLYGTLHAEVDRLVALGKIVILDIDVQGALALPKRPDLVRVFIAPPRFEELERRLRSRATEDEEALSRRLETARHELTLTEHYDHLVVNDDLTQTTETLIRLLEDARKEIG